MSAGPCQKSLWYIHSNRHGCLMRSHEGTTSVWSFTCSPIWLQTHWPWLAKVFKCSVYLSMRHVCLGISQGWISQSLSHQPEQCPANYIKKCTKKKTTPNKEDSSFWFNCISSTIRFFSSTNMPHGVSGKKICPPQLHDPWSSETSVKLATLALQLITAAAFQGGDGPRIPLFPAV